MLMRFVSFLELLCALVWAAGMVGVILLSWAARLILPVVLIWLLWRSMV